MKLPMCRNSPGLITFLTLVLFVRVCDRVVYAHPFCSACELWNLQCRYNSIRSPSRRTVEGACS